MSSIGTAPYMVTNDKSFKHNPKRVSPQLVDEILKALATVSGYGSIEIYVQDHQVTQITVRNIKKTRHTLAE